MSRKRTHSVTDKDKALKRVRIGINISNQDSEFSSDLHNKLSNANQTSPCIPFGKVKHLVDLMYQLDLSVLCLLRKFTYEYKYPLLSLAFEESGIDKFNNIVIRNKNKSIHIQIENVDKYYIGNDIGYARLFSKEKEKRSFFINDYLNSFVKHLTSKSNKIKYLVIYTNSDLDLTEEDKLKKGRAWSFYPFKFNSMSMEEYGIIKDFFFMNENKKGHVLYQFSKEETTRDELIKRLEFSSAAQKIIEEKQFSQEKVKKKFLDKLLFAVNQPNREELNSIVKNEIKASKVQDNYVSLQERILCDLTALNKFGPGTIYEYYLLMSFLHDLVLHKNMFSINFKQKSRDTYNYIIINYKGKITYVKAYYADSYIGYSLLFPSRTQERKSKFSINKHFTLFIEELEKDKEIENFIVYTNKCIDLTEENRLKKGQSENFHPLKFDSIDIQKKKYEFLKYCSCVNENSLCQFSQEESLKLLSLLKLPPSFQREKEEERLSDDNEKEIKLKFLDKLVFAVNQPNTEELNRFVKNEIENKLNNVPFNYEELREIALRWSESHEFGPITKGIMEKLLEDIKNNRSSYQEIQNKNIDKEIKFAKSVVGREGTPTFNQFLDFLIRGEGIKYLEVLKGKGINLPNMSSILNKAGNNAVKAFKDLYDLWFDAKGDKKQYLKALEDEGVNLPNMSSTLNGAGNNAAKAFKDLFDLWFDGEGNKTQYLKTLEDEGIDLTNVSSILNGAGANAPKAFKDLYDLWFDAKGNKTQYLKALEDEGVNLPNMSSIMNGAGNNAAKAFKDLYDLWFDGRGNKTQYLKTLEDKGVNLPSMSSILCGAGANASKAFKDLYDLWFDREGNKTRYLKAFGGKGVDLTNLSSILSRAGVNAAKSFKDLYDIWFDKEGKKSQYLRTLEEEKTNLTNVSSILHGAAANASKAFKDLFNLWFDREGNKTQYLKALEEKGINLTNVSSILNGAGANAAEAFKELYSIFFDKQGNEKQDLKHFLKKKDKEECFTLHNLSSMLGGAGVNVKNAFEKLHSVCFDDKGKRTELLDDFYNVGFRPGNLSCISCRAGVHASSILQRLHRVCFNEKREKTKLLDDFYNVGFSPDNLCNILSGAADSFTKFHDFLFAGESKKYLNNFLNEKEGFTLKNLSNILHGARGNVCSALKDFHDVCFDKTGDKTQILSDFHEAGFRLKDLSNILSIAGNNAASIFRNFHKLCFIKENYLNHFLAEKKLFAPKYLSKLLEGAGMKVCSIFEKLHDLCFDKAGNKTNYLNNLIKDNPSNKMQEILYKKIRKSFPIS